jgi:hypothetical protein
MYNLVYEIDTRVTQNNAQKEKKNTFVYLNLFAAYYSSTTFLK